MEKISIFIISLLFFVNNLYAKGEIDISPLQVAIGTAIHANEELNTKISIINRSVNTYIPFKFEENELPFASSKIAGTWPYLNSVLPEKYDILCLIVDDKNKNYKIIFINNQKIYFHEIFLTDFNMAKQCSLIVDISEESSKNLVSIMGKYKISNTCKKKVTVDDIRIVNCLFRTYGSDQSSEFIIYGYNSKIFGIIFGGLLLPSKHAPSFCIYSLFESMLAYFENLKNGDIDRCDVLFKDHLDLEIKKIDRFNEIENSARN